jgi:hypothetical protein
MSDRGEREAVAEIVRGMAMLSVDEQAHLDGALYPEALAGAGEQDSHRNRSIATSDYWHFLQAGGGSDAEAIALLTRGLRACATG